jgi:hypothetical protein
MQGYMVGKSAMLCGKTWLACCLLVITIGGGFAWAAEQQKSIQLLTQIQPRASLSLERTPITFVGTGGRQVILTQEDPVQVTGKVRVSASRPATLNIRAESDLEGPGGSIPIQQVEWTARGSETGNGVLSRTNGQMVDRWTTSGIHQTQIQFVLKNNGNLPAGRYATFVDFTVTSP